MFCTHCRRWRHPVWHTDCSTGQQGSLVVIDIASMRKGCRKCQQTWPVENVVFHCSCGHPQPVEYLEQLPPLEHGDKLLRTHGDVSWVRTKERFVRVGKLTR